MGKKVGLITYHAGYNYGSAFQTFATYRTLEMLGADVTIINYRPQSQKDNYCLLRRKMGIKTLINDIFLLPIAKKRKKRFDGFESFIQRRYKLTQEFCSPENFDKVCADFDVVVSGSDQLFNIRSEDLANHGWALMKPYLLHDVKCKKVSYASSINDLSDDELGLIAEDLYRFDYLSSREACSATRMEKFLKKSVVAVIDPTLLCDREFWDKEIGLECDSKEDYILYFAVNSGLRCGFKLVYNDLQRINPIARKLKCKIYVVTPFANVYFAGNQVVNIQDKSPEEFLKILNGAKLVFTKSYHGIALSISLNKDFYFLPDIGSTDVRKMDLLKRVGLENRAIEDIHELTFQEMRIDYSDINQRVQELKRKSLKYLDKAINE